MKRLAIAMLFAASCGAAPEVEEITQALTISNPYPNNPQNIFVGYRYDVQQTGVVFQRLGTGTPCAQNVTWVPMSGTGASPTQHYSVQGGSQADYMVHVQGDYYVGCGMGWMSWPGQDNGYVIDLNGNGGNDFMNCGGSAGVSNVCNGADGDDLIFVTSYRAEGVGGTGNDRFGIIATPVSSVHIWGDSGNDCVTWQGNVAGPIGSGGSGTDFIKSWAGSSYEFITTNNCGGIL